MLLRRTTRWRLSNYNSWIATCCKARSFESASITQPTNTIVRRVVSRAESRAESWADPTDKPPVMKAHKRESSFRFQPSPLPQYRYLPLDSSPGSIRLLRVFPAEDRDAIIRCEIFHTNLSSEPPYVALSYTWGDPAGLSRVYIKNEVVPVTHNLWRALRRLRQSSGEPVVVWADAICINQADISERSIQTSKMRTIYHNAESVEVWLGMDANGSRLAVQLTRELNMCQRGKASQIIRDPANAEALEALVVLFRRQYWWRIWVIQEISVAKRAIVYCGSESTPWNELDGVCDILREEEDFLQDMFYERPSFARTLLHGGPRGLHLSRYSPQNEAPPLLELLLSHKSKKSTDPKDKVFALVGISNARTSFGPIDYSRSLKDIFSHTARLIISSTRKLDIICVRQHDHITSDLPSWIPHWARPPVNFGALPVGLHHRRPEYTAAGNSLADFEFSHGGYVLKAGGFIVDTLSAVGMSFRQRGAPKNVEPVLHVFHDWWNLFVASTSNPQSTSAQSVFGRTIFCGNWAHDDKIMYEEKLKNMFELSEALLGRGNMLRLENPPFQSMENSTASLVEEIEDGEEEIGEKEQVSVAINASVMMNRRRLFVLKSGLVGLAPWDAATGDIVAILFGCRFPVILRRVGKRQGDKTYKLVGEAYIDGIMNGEAMARFQAGKYSRSEFEIH